MPNRHARLEASSSLERMLSNAVADERRRAERDIQAGVLQRLAAMRVVLSGHIESRGIGDGGWVAGITWGLDNAATELRETVSSGEPTLIASVGLATALEIATLTGEHSVSIDSGVSRSHPARAELAVYYACREAAQNVVRHAGDAAKTVIRLADDSDGIRFSVSDNGVGFDPATLRGGAGLLNINERVEAAGGHVVISAVPGAGVVIAGFVPDVLAPVGLDPAAPDADGMRAQILLEKDTERRRIMRDLHDGAQQSLVALRVRIGLALEMAQPDSDDLGVLGRLAAELDLAIAELRDLARGLLVTSGSVAVAPALRTVTRHWLMQVRVRERNLRRHGLRVESTVYGCVLETLQDARGRRDGGAGGTAVVSLFEATDAVHFVVRGRGAGFLTDRRTAARDAQRVVDRAVIAGGSLSMQRAPGGIVVRGTIPISGAAG